MPPVPKRSCQRRPARRGFTILEILVATAVFALLLLLVITVANSAVSASTLAKKRNAADSAARQALDRLSADLSRLILRKDLPQRIEKRPGNDAVTFYAQVAAYEGDRNVSQVAYGIVGDQFKRGTRGSYRDAQNGATLQFNSTALPAIEDLNSDAVGSGVFRYELSFLLADGTITNSVNTLTSDDPRQKVSAVIAAIAVLDPATRNMFPGSMSSLAALLADSKNGEDISASWNDALSTATGSGGEIPAHVRSAIRVYQRYFYLDQEN